ncbi:hypothetical protein [Azospirillum halopraeferens]|uniref:hypothetical protein n=1 Tax=Azospirillum halopraeferens TaxID=34010 RepID=UPI000428C563|nr:hypothetical protein [Azospirillum halopraeferens]
MDRPAPAVPRPAGHGMALALGAGVLAVWLGAMAFVLREAALPPETDGTVLVVFPPGTPDGRAFAAVVEAGGRPLRQTDVGFAWVARSDEPGFVGRLEAAGALGAFGELPIGPQLGGCMAVNADTGGPQTYRLQP